MLWEHSPVKEDCLICHAARLVERQAPRRSGFRASARSATCRAAISPGRSRPTSTFAFNRSCLNCHPQIHGSNSPSGPVLQR